MATVTRKSKNQSENVVPKVKRVRSRLHQNPSGKKEKSKKTKSTKKTPEISKLGNVLEVSAVTQPERPSLATPINLSGYSKTIFAQPHYPSIPIAHHTHAKKSPEWQLPNPMLAKQLLQEQEEARNRQEKLRLEVKKQRTMTPNVRVVLPELCAFELEHMFKVLEAEAVLNKTSRNLNTKRCKVFTEEDFVRYLGPCYRDSLSEQPPSASHSDSQQTKFGIEKQNGASGISKNPIFLC